MVVMRVTFCNATLRQNQSCVAAGLEQRAQKQIERALKEKEIARDLGIDEVLPQTAKMEQK